MRLSIVVLLAITSITTTAVAWELDVFWPNGGETLIIGSSTTIWWDTDLTGNV